MFNLKTAISLLGLLALPLLACAVIQAGTPTPTPLSATSTSTLTPISATQLARQTSLVLTRVARRTLAFPTKTPGPTRVFRTATRKPTQLTATPTPTLVLQANRVLIPAPALANNLLGETPQRELLVYLPFAYDVSQKHYPVVYYLLDFGFQGMPGGLRREDIEKDVDLDYAREMIIVFISGINSLGGSFYVNSPVTGNWDDFITHDVVGYMDAHYRTLPKPASRGLSGNAIGGSGALNLAMLHPDVFGAVYSLSPYLFDDNGLAESPMFSTQRMINDFVDLQTRELLLPVDEGLSDMQHNAGDAQFALAYGAAFAPNPQAKPPYVDYPYYRQNGQLFRDEAIWKRWEAGFGAAADKAQAYKENLLRLNNIAIDYSTNDPYVWVPKGCEYFAAKLSAAGIPNQLRRFSEDPHTNLEQRIRQFMLPFFSEKLEFDD